MSPRVASLALVTLLALAPNAGDARADDSEGDPTEPSRAALRWKNQLRESQLSLAFMQSEDTKHPQPATNDGLNGGEIAFTLGYLPRLKSFRVGGSVGVLGRAIDDKTFMFCPAYQEFTGGFRWKGLEAYSFFGLQWLTAGIGHANFAMGGLSPRAGVAAGLWLGTVMIHAFAATEYNWNFFGIDDYRTRMYGIRVTLLSYPRVE